MLDVAYLAGLAVGYWEDIEELESQWSRDKTFSPDMDEANRSELIKNWHKAVSRTRNWITK